MVSKLLHWAVDNVLVVLLACATLACAGGYAFSHVNVEAYPDPAPAIVEVIAQYPGRSAEEMERLVTIPLEVALAGMPGLKYTRTKSLFGLTYINNQFEYGVDYLRARQETINRLQLAALPEGVTPQISPRSPIGEILRYVVTGPKDAFGKNLYTLNDLRSLQGWTLEREFRRIPGIADATSFGGTVKRYEIQPDPDRMKRYGITLAQLTTAIADSNANVGGDYLVQGETASVVVGLGLLGRGRDPMQKAQSMTDASAARDYLRSEERRRLREIRQIVITSTNNNPVKVGDVVEGGPLAPGEERSNQGVIVSHQTRLGKVSLSRPVHDAAGHEKVEHGERVWADEDEAVLGLVLLRKGAESLPALQLVKEKIHELNTTPGRLPPGVKIDVFYDRSDLINTTTETVHENLLIGIVLVTIVLLMFLSNVRSALIIAINLPLALLFAFEVLYARGQSANLLSIGAVDFGIVIDSTVIMVENVYRVLSGWRQQELSTKDKIRIAAKEIDRSLWFSRLIMVCALLPVLTMQGAEGQLFRPMAETYAWALAGALLLSLTFAPVLCLLLFRDLTPRPDNFLVRFLKRGYLRNLNYCLDHRWQAMGIFGLLLAATVCSLPFLGREFMPPLEEGHVFVRGIFPVNVSLEQNSEKSRLARAVLRQYPQVEAVVSQLGRPEAGTDPTGFYSAEFFVPLKPQEQWPYDLAQTGWRKWFSAKRRHTKPELISEMNAELTSILPGVNWNFSQVIRDNVLEVTSGVQGENSVKIIGNDIVELEDLGRKVTAALRHVSGIKDVGLYRTMGQTNLELPIDRKKCSLWNVSVADVHNVIQTAIGGKMVSQMIEGEKSFDITLRWPQRLRNDESVILDIPVDVSDHRVSQNSTAGMTATPFYGQSAGIASTGFSSTMPSLTGSMFDSDPLGSLSVPRERLRDLITPLGADRDGPLDPQGDFLQSGASMISREMGHRMIAVKFSVRDRDLASTVADAKQSIAGMIPIGYRTEWSGEFRQMEEGEGRLMVIIPIALALVFLLLYLAFKSFLDALMVFANVLALSMGGVWALLITGTNFSISAAVGFTSIFGVAIMDGLLLISSFNQLRSHGLPLRQAILDGADKRVRPVMMTALTAIFGLLPAAVSVKIGAQSQKPLAIVVVGAMLSTLFLTRYLMPVLYSFYGHREPPAGGSSMAH